MKRTVRRVVDGDTFEVKRRIGGTNRVRLAGVHAPERRTRGGIGATNRLRRLIDGKTVTIVPVGKSYGRVVTNVRYKRKLVNKRL